MGSHRDGVSFNYSTRAGEHMCLNPFNPRWALHISHSDVHIDLAVINFLCCAVVIVFLSNIIGVLTDF